MGRGGKEKNQGGGALNSIFTALESGVKVSDITAALDKRVQEEEEARHRGRESEVIAREKLAKLPYISHAKVAAADNLQADRRSRDVIATINSENYYARFGDIWVPNSLTVSVQVKSSSLGVDQFLRSQQAKHNFNHEQLWRMFRNKRLVVLNVRLPDNQIYEQFETQLTEINNFWKTKDIPVGWK